MAWLDEWLRFQTGLSGPTDRFSAVLLRFVSDRSVSFSDQSPGVTVFVCFRVREAASAWTERDASVSSSEFSGAVRSLLLGSWVPKRAARRVPCVETCGHLVSSFQVTLSFFENLGDPFLRAHSVTHGDGGKY